MSFHLRRRKVALVGQRQTSGGATAITKRRRHAAPASSLDRAPCTTSSKRKRKQKSMHGITCPSCEHKKSCVLYTRKQESYITRRRECCRCKTRFTTRERLIGNCKGNEADS